MSRIEDLSFSPERDDCPVCPIDGFCDLTCVMGTEATDRSAGRWCAVCEQFGNHHTERHDEHGFSLPSLWGGDQA